MAMELGSVEVAIQNVDGNNESTVEHGSPTRALTVLPKGNDETCLEIATLGGDPTCTEASDVDIDGLSTVKSLLPLLGILQKKNAGTIVESILEKAFSKLGLQREESFSAQNNAEAKTESSWYEYVEGIVRDCGDSFWMKVAQKTQSLNVGKLDAIIEVLIDSLVESLGSTNEALLWVLGPNKMPEVLVDILVKHLLQRNTNSVFAVDSCRNTPLHLAAKSGLEIIVKHLLKHAAPVTACNSEGKTPLQLAIDLQHNEVATAIIKKMEPGRVRQLFECRGNEPSQLKLQSLIENQEMQSTTLAVLDAMMEPVIDQSDTYVIYYGILDGDTEGRPPTHPHFNNTHKSCLHIIAKSNNKDIVYHDVIRLLLRRKWKKFARFVFLINFLCYLLLMASLVCALVIAARKQRPELYDNKIDIFRGLCEAVVIIFVGWNGLAEGRQLVKHKIFYFHDTSNYLDVAAIIFTFLIIPFRIAGLNVQWVFASLCYLCNCLRGFKYTPVFRSTGAYTQILYKVVSQDVVRFSAVFLVFLVSFSGCLYFALRSEVQVATNSTGNTTIFMTDLGLYPYETSEYYDVLFTGLRVLIQGNVLDGYFGPNGFGWFAVIVYMVFLFLVSVVLLNLLIAQMADTYGSVQQDAQQSLTLNRAWIVARIEHNSFLTHDFRQRFFRSCEVIENPSGVLEKWETPPINEVNKSLERLERVVKKQHIVINELRNTVEKSLQKQEELLLQLLNTANKVPQQQQ